MEVIHYVSTRGLTGTYRVNRGGNRVLEFRGQSGPQLLKFRGPSAISFYELKDV